MKGVRMDDSYKYQSWLYKPKDFDDISELLWGAIILDWQWALQTTVWKQHHSSS